MFSVIHAVHRRDRAALIEDVAAEPRQALRPNEKSSSKASSKRFFWASVRTL